MAMADDLWRECAAWLTRCNVIPPDHKANGPDSEIRVLALTLRDGVLLCNLLNFIDANALDMKDFNRKPQMAQVCVFSFHSLVCKTNALCPLPVDQIQRSDPMHSCEQQQNHHYLNSFRLRSIAATNFE